MNLSNHANASIPIRHLAPCWEQNRGQYGCNYWEVYSPKLNRDVKLYSDLEEEHWLLLESDPNVIAFCEQPVRMLGLVGEGGSSFIDMWVLLSDGSEEYRETKYSKDVASSNSQISIQKSWCERNNHIHRVITEIDLMPFKMQITNCSRYIGFIPQQPNSRHKKLQQAVYDVISSCESVILKELIGMFVGSSENQILSAVFTLVHQGMLDAPLSTKQFSMNMLITPRR